jgi:hypothetical protein
MNPLNRGEVVRVGVTGHRILAEHDKLIAGIDEALAKIEQSFPHRSLALVSALAEGADRLVAHRVISRPGARLIALLPLPRADYLSDFKSAASRNEFLRLLERADEVTELPAPESRGKAYAAAGRAMLERSDVLITIWDGQGAQGEGGTGSIVALARKRGLPVAWVHAGNRQAGTQEPTSLGAEQGNVTFERFPSTNR